ncbi:AAA family ATPase, partial [Bradyrhizobium sp.]|uniref:AAA family ATPase n=1 Tax=Bradyrhizobium sp. TaxID=376 RepID=UPI00262DAAAB
MSDDTSDTDEFGLQDVEGDAASTGAAADSSDLDEGLKKLPRLLRYAMLARRSSRDIDERLIAEIRQLCPGLPHTVLWATSKGADSGLALAAELDRLAVTGDTPTLRSLADCVRLLCLPAPRDLASFDEYRRVGKALIIALANLREDDSSHELLSELEEFVYGWAALPACPLVESKTAAFNAAIVGPRTARYRVVEAKAEERRWLKAAEQERRERQEAETRTAADHKLQSEVSSVPANHVMVARLADDQMKGVKIKEVLGPLKGVINVALPLIEPPPLHEVRNALLFEFPYALDVIDFALADLVGRTTVHLRPLLIVGEPGGGKSRFARRLGENLGLSVWREDASRADGAVFGGTDRRWYSAEPCHPFLAVAQASSANPLVLIDEIEKAGTRNDYGRLWDCLLGFLEPETNARYPDPALQTTL